jgi:carotenoid cleavage dioxygenase
MLDPATLMPSGPDGGYETYGNKLCGPFTAHPKLDPETGEMVFFGYSAKGRFTKEVSLQADDRNGTITRAEILEGPYPSMIHDFAVTKNWIVLPIFPLTQVVLTRPVATTCRPPSRRSHRPRERTGSRPRRGTSSDCRRTRRRHTPHRM